MNKRAQLILLTILAVFLMSCTRPASSLPAVNRAETEVAQLNPGGLPSAGELSPTSTGIPTLLPSEEAIEAAETPSPTDNPAPQGTTWYFAEGFTGGGVLTFIALLNPNDTPATVDVTYLIQESGPVDRRHIIEPLTRYTIAVHDPAELGPEQTFATIIHSDLPIIAERSMYFWQAGHSAIGTTSLSPTWYFAEGFTGTNTETYILILNPNDSQANVSVDYLIKGIGVVNRLHTVPGQSRITITTQDQSEVGPEAEFGTIIRADLPIVAERAMYTKNPDNTIATGTITNGVAFP